MDKTKITQSATRYAQKGQYDKAIAEYRRILDKDPKDVRVLLKVGELLQKKGDDQEAAATMMSVAEGYANEGFFLKAVAVLKQVIKLDPSRVDVNLRLAELYQQLGLLQDAMTQLQAAASQLDKQGQANASIDVLRRMVALDPENLASRIRLAEVYAASDQKGEALRELRRAAESLRSGSRIEDYLKVGERIVALDPRDVDLGRELAHAYLAKNDARRALARLQTCFQEDPRSVETLELLARAFRAVNQEGKAASVYKELAKVHRDAGRTADERAAWKLALDLAPGDEEARDALGEGKEAAANPAPSAPPLQPAAAPARAAPPAPPVAPAVAAGSSRAAAPSVASRSQMSTVGDGTEAVGRLLTEIDVFLKYGLVEKARLHLGRILSLDPDSIEGHEKALLIHADRDPQAKLESHAALARLHRQAGDIEAGRPHWEALREAGHPLAAGFADAYEGGGEAAQILDVEVAEEPISADLLDLPDEPIFAGADEAIVPISAGEEEVVILEGPETSEVIELDVGGEVQPPPDSALELVAESGDELYEPEADEVPEALDGDPFANEARGALDVVVEDSFGEDEAIDADDLDGDPFAEGAEIEVADDDEEDGEEVVVATETVEAQDDREEETRIDPAPNEATAIAPAPEDPTRIADESEEPGEGAADEPMSEFELDDDEDGDFPPPPPSFGGLVADDNPWQLSAEKLGDLQAELDEARFYVEQGMYAEAEELYRRALTKAPGHPEVMERLAELAGKRGDAPVPAPESSGGQFDLGAALAAELFDDEDLGDETPQANAFEEFQRADEGPRPEDAETHLELAIAYREMGLLSDAIATLELALAGCRGGAREAECLLIAGQCHLAQGDAQRAIEVLREALAVESVSDESKAAIHFELAQSLEATGEKDKALAEYGRVARIDGAYRGVKQEIARLVAAGARLESQREGPGKLQS